MNPCWSLIWPVSWPIIFIFRIEYRLLRFFFIPVMPSLFTDVFSQIRVKDHCLCEISPRPSQICRLFWTFSSKAAPLKYISVCLSLCRRCRSIITVHRFISILRMNFTLFEICRCTSKNKIHIPFYVTIPIMLSSIDPLCELFRSGKSKFFQFIWWKRSGK